jgi:molybdopterin-guanine dinucleotide biosynthesis protein A
MGRDKAALPWGGATLLEHVVGVLGEATDRVIVVGRAGQSLPAVSCERVDDPAGLVPGPLLGALAGLESLAKRSVEAAYLTAVDTPFLTTAHVWQMLERLAGHRAVAVEAIHGQLEPLISAVVVEPALAMARRLVAQGERSVKALLRRLGALGLPLAELPDPRVVWACNTPADLAAAWSTAELEARR